MVDDYRVPDGMSEDGLNGLDVEQLIELGAAFVNHGILPEAGGWNQQPRWFTDAMQRVYLPGLSRARYEALDADAKARYHAAPQRAKRAEGVAW